MRVLKRNKALRMSLYIALLSKVSSKDMQVTHIYCYLTGFKFEASLSQTCVESYYKGLVSGLVAYYCSVLVHRCSICVVMILNPS